MERRVKIDTVKKSAKLFLSKLFISLPRSEQIDIRTQAVVPHLRNLEVTQLTIQEQEGAILEEQAPTIPEEHPEPVPDAEERPECVQAAEDQLNCGPFIDDGIREPPQSHDDRELVMSLMVKKIMLVQGQHLWHLHLTSSQDEECY